MAGIGFELKKLFRRKGLFASLRAYGYAGIICTGPMLLGVALQMGILLLCGWVGGRAGPAGLTRLHDHLYAAVLPYRHQLFLHAGDALPGRYALRGAGAGYPALVLGLFQPDAGAGVQPVRAVPPCLRGHPAAGAALPVALRGDDRELERHELPHGHQGLPGHPLLIFSGHRAGVRAGAGTGGPAGLPGAGGDALCRGHGLRPDDGLGRGAALPVFPAER